MLKRATVVLAVLLFSFSLTGCATTRKKNEIEIQNLKNQVSLLESQIQSKDDEINILKDALTKAAQEKQQVSSRQIAKKSRFIGEVKSRPNVKQIQIALSNAGYNPGRQDGRMGPKTVEAIKAFQSSNNLPADGKVGKKTWGLLKEYLYKQVK